MILDNTFPPDARVENEASMLIKNGFKVYLFCISFGKTKQAANEIYNNIVINRKNYPKVLRRLAALAYSFPIYHLWLQRAIRKYLVNNQIDAIHIHDIQVARAVFRINKKIGLPIILDLHENRPEIMKFYPHVVSFPGKILINPVSWEKFESRFIFKSTKTLVVTEEAKKYYIKKLGLPPEHFLVIPNTVTESFISGYTINESILKKYEGQFMVLYIGDTGLRRGIITVLDSILLLKDKIPEIKFVFVGISKDDDKIKKHLSDIAVGPWVEFVGWQDPSLFQSYILASKVCISPLLRNIHHDTTYANKIFQYLSMGRALVVSDCPAQAAVVRNTGSGLVHRAGDSKDFAEKIYSLYEDHETRERMGHHGKNFIEKEFTWEKTSLSMSEFYKELETTLKENDSK